MKNCPRCKKSKPLSSFWKDKHRTDGYSTYCIVCWRDKYRESRSKNLDKRREKDRRYYLKNKEEIMRKRLEDYHRNKHKYKAREAVKTALYKGELIRPDRCSKCSRKDKLEAHHPDYSKPLNIVWLCIPCHRIEDFGK